MVAKKKSTPAKERTSRKHATSTEKYNKVLEEMQEDSQVYLILKHLLEHGSITPKEAAKGPIYSMRLSARIHDLRHEYNIPIESESVTKKRNKKTVTYARYYIGG